MAGMPTIIDISPRLDPSLAVWPGDAPLSREVLLDQTWGDSVTLSTLKATVHLGAHADAPLHYGVHGSDIADRPLELYLGNCQVMRIPAARGSRIGPGDLTSPIRAARVLFATGTYPDPSRFTGDFAALDPSLIAFLHERGVRLVGIDTPSVDLFSSRELETHRAILARDMAILEGLVLDHVSEGLYELIALPLALVGFDASPVRAILRSLMP